MLRGDKCAWHEEECALSRHELATRDGACRHTTFTLSADVRNAKATGLALVDRFVFGLRPAVMDLAREDAGGGAVTGP